MKIYIEHESAKALKLSPIEKGMIVPIMTTIYDEALDVYNQRDLTLGEVELHTTCVVEMADQYFQLEANFSFDPEPEIFINTLKRLTEDEWANYQLDIIAKKEGVLISK